VAKRDLLRDQPGKIRYGNSGWEFRNIMATTILVIAISGKTDSLISDKFPCSVCRQEERNIRKLIANSIDREILHATLGAKARKFPVFFPVSREFSRRTVR
jgi:hypothetical protein